jgi:signal transduction histidine kinase/ligand-binding sensor domain-containing protein
MLRILMFLLLLAHALMAQVPNVNSDFLVRVWQTEEGLPGNVVRSVGQTSDGFLWVATAEGLARFDGRKFDHISSSGDSQLPVPGLFRVFTPQDGSVWGATHRGGLMKVEGEELKKIVEDTEGRVRQLVTQLIVFDGIIFFIRDGKVWSLEGGKAVLVSEPPTGLAAALESDRQLELRRGRSDDTKSPTQLIDRDGGKWVLQDGLLRYLSTGGTAISAPIPGLNGPLAASDFLEDNEGNLWLASPVQGLIRIRHQRVKHLATVDGAYSFAVHTAIEDREGTWWLANRNGGVDRIRDGVMSHLPLVTRGMTRTVACIFQDKSGRLWFAGRDSSVFGWNGDTFYGHFTDTPALSKINAIAEDADGRLWFGGHRGLWRWNGMVLEDFTNHSILAGAAFSTLIFDPAGNLLVGTIDGRVFSFDGNAFRAIGKSGDLLNRRVSTIYPRNNGEMWVSTVGAGLFLRKDDRWYRFGSQEGIPDERLTGLTMEGDWLWMGSLGGIIRVSRTELLRRVSNNQLDPHWLRLDRADGMITRECVGGSQPGVFRSADGSLWFPTAAGLAGIKPERIATNKIPPTIRFNPVEINGALRPLKTEAIVAGPGRVSITFNFNGLSLTAPEKVTYRVQLVGLEERPRSIGSRREVAYQAVPPGIYTFEVTAINGDGVNTPQPATLSLEILPHVWETVWFKALVGIFGLFIALSIGWLIARHRMKRKIREMRLSGMLEAERSRISSDLHDDLGASLTELSILSEIAAEDPDEETLRPSLNQLSVKAKRVVGALDEIVWATNPTEDSLVSLVEYLPAYVREFLEVVHVPLRTKIERQIPDLAIGPRRRHSVLLATREAVNNAVKYARSPSIFLRIAIEDGQLIVQVQDDGLGFDVEYAISGNGLKNMRNRMTDCGGNCSIESVRGQGTTITLTLPLPS